jgi:outer membrane protein assembly factor BamD
MHRFFFTVLALGMLAAPMLHAQISLNPLNWFESTTEGSTALNHKKQAKTADTELSIAREQYDAGHLSAANRKLKKIIKDYPMSPAAGEALHLQGLIYMSKERWKKGFDKLQRVIAEHPGYEHFDRIISAQFDCATALMEGARGRILWIFPGFKQYDTAAKQFEQIVSNAPYSDYAPLSLMNIALVSGTREEPEEAIDALDRLINYYPQSMLAPDAYYNLAQTYSNLVQGEEYDQGSTRQAISYYEDFLILFPSSNYTGEVKAQLKQMENLLAGSRLNLGNFYYYYRNNNTAALVFYNEAITIAPDSEAATEARSRIQDIEAGVRPTNKASLLRKLLMAE